MYSNFSAQKANALDKVAQAIPAVKAGLINTLKGFGGDKGGLGLGGGGGYGAPKPPPSYGAPQQPTYGTSQPQSYNAPQQSYNSPQTGYGVPQGPVIGVQQNQQQNFGQQNVIPTNINVIPTSNNNNQNQFQPSVLQPQTVQSTLNFGNNQQQQVFNNAAQTAPGNIDFMPRYNQ